jgi:hypothetical protein
MSQFRREDQMEQIEQIPPATPVMALSGAAPA